MAYPQRYVLDPSIIGTADAEKAQGRVQVRRDRPRHAGGDDRSSSAGAVIWATGWKPYDAAKIQPYGYDRFRQRHHQRRVRAPGRSARPHRRQNHAPLRRQGGEEHRVHPVRRLARREPSAPLLAHLLHGLAQADAIRDARRTAKARAPASQRSITSTSAPSTASRISTLKVQRDPTVKFVKSKVARIAQDAGSGNLDPARR